MPAPGTSDLTLNLLDLETGEQQVITPIVSKEYPANFAKAAKNLNDPDTTAESLYEAYQNGITSSIAWSPDGRYLAFAGQVDGLSSDLYVYDVETREIRRLSSGDQELQWIDWSPDGKWIMHASVFWVGQGMSYDIYAAAADGSSVRYLSTSSLYGGIEKWVNSHEYLENDSQNGPGEYGLRSVDINTGKIKHIWDGSFTSYGMDRDGKWIVLMALSPDADPFLQSDSDPNFTPGFYLVNLETLEKTPIPFPSDGSTQNQDLPPVDPGQEIIFLSNPGGSHVFYLSSTGEVTPYELENATISVSPSQKYWVAVADQEIRVFTMENTELARVPFLPGMDLNYFDITWRPDDSGLFLVSGTDIYSMDIQNKTVHLVETSVAENFGFPKWIYRQ
jgi:WD40 repeat protein